MKKRRVFFKSIFSRFSFAIIVILLFSFLSFLTIAGVSINHYYTELRCDELSYVSLSAREVIADRYRAYRKEYDTTSFLDDNHRSLTEELSKLTDEFPNFILITDQSGTVKCVDRSAGTLKTLAISSDIMTEVMSQVRNGSEREGRGTLGVFEVDHYYTVTNVYFTSGEYVATVWTCVPVYVVKQPINSIIRLIVYIAVFVMGIALLASYLISRRITNPLAKMAVAAKAFANGDYSVRVAIKSADEIGEFATVFNEMAASLEDIEKTRNDFVANVSHDLRSPMTSIHGFIDGMISGVIPPEQHNHYLRIVLNETKRLSRLISTLLDISRIQAGERKFKMVSFDVCEMARQILFSFENRIDEKNLDIQFEFENERIYVSADMDAIYQVFYNLCDNAVKFSKDDGCIKVSIVEREGKIAISVYNEGEGISPEDIKQVFDRFYKADKSRGMDKTGTGLGLYFAKKIMEAHKQTITVESEYQSFCLFTFTLDKGENTGRRYHKNNV